MFDKLRHMVHNRNLCHLYRTSFRYSSSHILCAICSTHFTVGSGFTLKSSKGNCAISNSQLSCASGNTATVFTVSLPMRSFIIVY